MDVKELDNFLRQHTRREINYLTNPNYLSSHYKNLKKLISDRKEYYIFEFKSVLKENKIAMHKDDRFTYLRPHTHNVIELNYIYSGKCTYLINGTPKTLYKGDLCILDTNVIHSTERLQENDIVLNIAMTKSFFSTGFLTRLSNHGVIANFLLNAISDNQNHYQYIVLRSQDKSKIPSIVENLSCEYFDQIIGSAEVIDSYMIILFTEILRTIQLRENIEFFESKKDTQLIKILEYIQSNYLTCTLSEVAHTFGYNINYLSTFLKKKTGKSFKELKLIQQMTFASFLLINSQKTVHEIADEAGFSNHGFFFNKFQSYFSMSPKEYRELNRQGKHL
ncbi:melibiose operon regulatory protein [Clostridium puniceum]|uniref:Melibiose operon regulatory protein n=1 Tax=Clostridium puniceum TaxID=29367 RepID=A0A1S8TAY5_9CLOT|nr:AraC family transcriptional regulator [Clostridium puniceum]OOM74779.1 melibiose operon regulatory protein [Clostridium puniceum]